MSKKIYSLIVAAAALIASGCSDRFEDEDFTIAGESSGLPENCIVVEPRISGAGADGTAESRTSLAGRNVVWSADDQIGVFSPEAYYEWSLAAVPDSRFYNNPIVNMAYRVDAGAGSSAATFTLGDYYNADVQAATGRWGWNTAYDVHNFYAYYPYSDNVKANTKYESVAFTLPQVQNQTGVDNSDHVAAYDFLYAHTEVALPEDAADKQVSGIDVNFAFEHAFALMKFTVSNTTGEAFVLRKVRLTASEGTWLTGESVIDLATGAVTMGRKADAMGAAVEGAAYNSAEVSLGDGVTLESRGSATVYMVVNAADLTDGMAKVEVVTDRGGKEFSVGGKLLEPGKQYTKTLSVNALTEYKSVTVGFEDVAAKYLAGPTSYGGNLYSAYTGEGGQFTGYLDEASGLYFGINRVENPSYGGEYEFWNGGFAISQWNDMATAGYLNQCSVYFKDGTTGKGGHDGSATFAVANGYCDAEPTAYSSDKRPVLYFEDGETERVIDHCYISNATYTYLSMAQGDNMAKKFTYEDKDYFVVTATGFDRDGSETGTVQICLADFRTADSGGIVTGWQKFDLSSLGAVNRIVFNCQSSDVGAYGMNTPAYFCVDDIVLREAFE